MLEEVKKSLEASPIVKKGDYNYFVNPISDGVPTMKPSMLRELANVVKEHVDMDIDKIVAIEAMGIHLATALSLATDIPFVIIRKRQYGLEGEKEIGMTRNEIHITVEKYIKKELENGNVECDESFE